MTDAAVDPLRREFVDIAEPLASKVSPSSYDNSEGVQVKSARCACVLCACLHSGACDRTLTEHTELICVTSFCVSLIRKCLCRFSSFF